MGELEKMLVRNALDATGNVGETGRHGAWWSLRYEDDEWWYWAGDEDADLPISDCAAAAILERHFREWLAKDHIVRISGGDGTQWSVEAQHYGDVVDEAKYETAETLLDALAAVVLAVGKKP